MAQKRKSMEIKKEIIRLKVLGNSNRNIAKIIGINKDTVAKYLKEDPAPSVVETPLWVKNLNWTEVKEEIKLNVPKNILYEELSEK